MSLKSAFIEFIGSIRFYKGGIVIFGDSTCKLKGPDCREILRVLKPGDIVLNAHHNYVSSLFIKGDYGHSGIYVGDNQIIHVRARGILKEDILTFLRADDAAVIRVKDQTIVDSMICKAYEQFAKDVKYDFDFDKQDDEQFYCTEFTDFCSGYLLREGVSRNNKYIYPDDYLIPSKLFEIVWQRHRG